ncbi:MAG: hypothetical protein ACJ8FT_00040 [Sphingomonas sp.]
MIALLMASSINLTALQASISAPTDAFRGCLREAASKAKSEKVSGDGIEAYLRNACSVQMGSLKQALVSFRMKNGMSQKAAAADANMTVEDYVATPADNYKFLAQMNAPKPAAPAPAPTASAATPAPTPAAAPTHPPKP